VETIDSLKAKLTSKDQEVLLLCDTYLDQRIEKERLRGEAAERRASIILAASGAASAFLGLFFNKLPEVTDLNNSFITVLYSASALWLFRALWYSIKSIHMQSRKSVLADTIFEFQENSKVDAIKTIIACKIWELNHSIYPNTERLFYVQRAQRAFIVFIGLIFLEGVALPLKAILVSAYFKCLATGLILPIILFFFFGDKFIEKRGIWNHD